MVRDATFHHVDNEDWTDCADAQADLKFPWTDMSEDTQTRYHNFSQ